MPSLSAIRSILVIKPSSLGDIVHALPAVARVRRDFPEARLSWLVNSEWAPLLAGNPSIDEVIEFPRREFRGPRGWRHIAPWARRLRGRVRADLVLDFQGLLRSALLARLSRNKNGRILGLSDAREGARFFYHQRAEVRGIPHAVDRYLELARFAREMAGGNSSAAEATLEWPLPFGSCPAGIEPEESHLLLHPFSRGADKSLSADEVRAFCRALAPRRVVVVGRSESAIELAPNGIDLLNRTTLHELIWLIRHATFIVSVDSGPMHIAAALTPRLVSIHSWSDPAKVGPYQPDAWVWKAGRIFQMRDTANSRSHQSCPSIANLAAFVLSQLASH